MYKNIDNRYEEDTTAVITPVLGEAKAILIKLDTSKFIASKLDNRGKIIKGDSYGETVDTPERTGNTLSQKTGKKVSITKGNPAICRKFVTAHNKISIFYTTKLLSWRYIFYDSNWNG